MSTPRPGILPGPATRNGDPAARDERRVDARDDVVAVLPSSAVVAGPAPRPAPAVVPARVEPAAPWSGTVIEPVPTTADDIAALVLAVPDVVRLHGGRLGEVATYLPGRRVTGIKIGDDLIEVHIVVAGRTPVRETAQLVRAAVATMVATPVHVHVEDLAVA